MEAIISFVIEKWPFLVVVIIAVFITFLAVKWYFKSYCATVEKAGNANNRIDSLPCETMRNDLQNAKARLDSLPCGKHDDNFRAIMESLTEIKTFLMVKNPKTAFVFSQKHSPRMLNKAGESLFNDISGSVFLDANKDFLILEIDGKSPKTALDVENGALQALYDNLDNDIFNGLKKWVYNSPSRKVEINGEETDYVVTMTDVCFVLSLPLRDIYLQLHPELQ